jgi:YegS/Rv2252/BmrU family lipid kinase
MRKIKVILNPVAGKGEGLKKKSWLIDSLEAMNVDYDLEISQSLGEIERIARAIDVNSYNEVIVVGGDGSLVEAVNGLGKKDVVLGIVPVGTGNDFARTLLGSTSPDEMMEKIRVGNHKVVDTGSVNGRSFINVTGFGIDSYILENMIKVKRFFGGSLAYFISTVYTLFKYKSKHVKISINGSNFDRDIMLAAISNGKYFGGGMKISPNAEVDDGLFELVLVSKMNKPKFLVLFTKVYKGMHLGVAEVEVFKSNRIQIESQESIPINVDGNLYGSTPIDVEVSDKKIKMFC